MLDLDAILQAMRAWDVDCILIGGMNFLLNHQPYLTYDVDLWVNDEPKNVSSLNGALRSLGAQWGATEASWGPLPDDPAWLHRQSVYCLTTTAGPLDIFFEVRGLEGGYQTCRTAALPRTTAAGLPYLSLSDADMLACQEALDEPERKRDRMAILKAALDRRPSTR